MSPVNLAFSNPASECKFHGSCWVYYIRSWKTFKEEENHCCSDLRYLILNFIYFLLIDKCIMYLYFPSVQYSPQNKKASIELKSVLIFCCPIKILFFLAPRVKREIYSEVRKIKTKTSVFLRLNLNCKMWLRITTVCYHSLYLSELVHSVTNGTKKFSSMPSETAILSRFIKRPRGQDNVHSFWCRQSHMKDRSIVINKDVKRKVKKRI